MISPSKFLVRKFSSQLTSPHVFRFLESSTLKLVVFTEIISTWRTMKYSYSRIVKIMFIWEKPYASMLFQGYRLHLFSRKGVLPFIKSVIEKSLCQVETTKVIWIFHQFSSRKKGKWTERQERRIENQGQRQKWTRGAKKTQMSKHMKNTAKEELTYIIHRNLNSTGQL